MAGFFATPPTLQGTLLSTVPRELYAEGTSDWAPGNGAPPPIFLEGITTDTQGNLFVVDIPYGRILRLDLSTIPSPASPGSASGPGPSEPNGEWGVVATFRGNPNGLALGRDGNILIADYQEGLLACDPSTGAVSPRLTRRNLERFKGPNDLIVASNGDICASPDASAGVEGVRLRRSKRGVHGQCHGGCGSNGPR